VLDPDEQALEDLYTKEIIREQGFDGPPDIVSRPVLDRYVRLGEIELFRGLAHARYADSFREGDFFIGRGAFGSGAYAAGGSDGLDIARRFAQGTRGAILRMTLKAGARTADFDEFIRFATRERDRTIRDLREAQAQAARTAQERGGGARGARALRGTGQSCPRPIR
jgi:hypothetical protein